MTIVEFLLARYAEREQAAQVAVIPAHDGPNAYKPHPELAEWRYVPGGEVEYVSTPEMQRHEYAQKYYVTCDGEGCTPAVNEQVGPHIALNDPAYVLDDLAAKRRIVEGPNGGGGPDHHDEWGETLQLLALPFAAHPDYDPAWAAS